MQKPENSFRLVPSIIKETMKIDSQLAEQSRNTHTKKIQSNGEPPFFKVG